MRYRNWPNVYKDLGIKPIINAQSWVTSLGGSIMKPEVIKSIEEASTVFIELEKLNEEAGKFIAKICKSDGALVTNGCASAIVLMSAACLTGTDIEEAKKLPNKEHKRSEILIHKGQRNRYDSSFEIPGSKIVEYTNENLFDKITDKTCAIAYVVAPFFDKGFGMKETIEIAHEKGLYFLVDAAAELPPRENLSKFIELGADGVAFSGGKGIGGPQSTGILAGTREIIDAAFINSFQNLTPEWSGIGRPMKVSKENVIGLITAMKLFIEEDESTENKLWMGKAKSLKEQINPKKGMAINIENDYPNRQGPNTILSFQKKNYEGPTTKEIRQFLENGEPKIFVGKHNYDEEINIVVHSLNEFEIDIIAEKLNEIL